MTACRAPLDLRAFFYLAAVAASVVAAACLGVNGPCMYTCLFGLNSRFQPSWHWGFTKLLPLGGQLQRSQQAAHEAADQAVLSL